MFLLILSKIGIVVLILLGIILAFVLLLLFYPFIYKVRVTKQEEMKLSGEVFWLFYLIHILFSIQDGNVSWEIKILGFSLKGLFDKRRKGKKNKEKKAKKQPVIKPGEKADKQVERDAKAAAEKEIKRKNQGSLKKDDLDIFEDEESEPEMVDKVNAFIAAIPEKVRFIINLCYAYSAVRKRVFKIIKHILPKKIKGFVDYGFDSPSATGKVLGLICVFYPVLPKDLVIRPDFQNEIFVCDLTAKGRFFLIYLLVHGLKIYFNEKVKTVMGRNKGGK